MGCTEWYACGGSVRRGATVAQVDKERAYELGSCGCCGPYPAFMYSPVTEMRARLKFRRQNGRRAERRSFQPESCLCYFRTTRGRRSAIETRSMRL